MTRGAALCAVFFAWRVWAIDCPAPFHALGADACIAVPAAPTRSVLLYFHGLTAEPWSTKVRPELIALWRHAHAEGHIVIALRGEKGLCTWSDEVRDAWCWPNGLVQLSRVAEQMARVRVVLAAATKHVKHPLSRPVVIGFSNGGFFTSMLASEGALEARAFVIVQGGAVSEQRFSPSTPKRPALLLVAQSDLIQTPRMRALSMLMKDAGWEPHMVSRPGQHELNETDARNIMAFVRRLGH